MKLYEQPVEITPRVQGMKHTPSYEKPVHHHKKPDETTPWSLVLIKGAAFQKSLIQKQLLCVDIDHFLTRKREKFPPPSVDLCRRICGQLENLLKQLTDWSERNVSDIAGDMQAFSNDLVKAIEKNQEDVFSLVDESRMHGYFISGRYDQYDLYQPLQRIRYFLQDRHHQQDHYLHARDRYLHARDRYQSTGDLYRLRRRNMARYQSLIKIIGCRTARQLQLIMQELEQDSSGLIEIVSLYYFEEVMLFEEMMFEETMLLFLEEEKLSQLEPDVASQVQSSQDNQGMPSTDEVQSSKDSHGQPSSQMQGQLSTEESQSTGVPSIRMLTMMDCMLMSRHQRVTCTCEQIRTLCLLPLTFVPIEHLGNERGILDDLRRELSRYLKLL